MTFMTLATERISITKIEGTEDILSNGLDKLHHQWQIETNYFARDELKEGLWQTSKKVLQKLEHGPFYHIFIQDVDEDRPYAFFYTPRTNEFVDIAGQKHDINEFLDDETIALMDKEEQV